MPRRLLLFFIYNFFSFGLAAAPFEFFYLNSRGLSFERFAWLQSIYYATMVCLDVPTGIFADRVSRKIALILGPIGFAIGFGLCVIADSFFFFAIAHVIIGAGHAFISGALSSFLFDSLKEETEEAHFLHIESLNTSLRLFGTSLAFFAGGWLSKHYGLEWSFGLTAVLTGFAAFIALFLKEPKTHAHKHLRAREIFTESWKSIVHHKEIRWITIYYAFLFIWLRVAFHTYQVEFQQRGIEDYADIGLIYCLLNITAALFSRFARSVQKKLGEGLLFAGMQACLILSFTFLGMTQSKWAVALFFLQQLPFGLHFPVVSNYVNQKISSDRRTTVLSFQSMIGRLAFTLYFPLFGWFESQTSLKEALLYSATLGAVAMFWLSLRRPK